MEVVTESRRHCRNEDTALLGWSEVVPVDELSGKGAELRGKMPDNAPRSQRGYAAPHLGEAS